MCAVYYNFPTTMQILLNHRNIDVNLRSKSGKTTLILAAEGCPVSIAKALLEKGAEIDKTDGKECTPLLYAVDRDDLSMVQFLIDQGANWEHKDSNGRSLMHRAAIGNRRRVLQWLLEKTGKCLDVNLQTITDKIALL